MSVPKEELHKMVDALPEDKTLILKKFLESLLDTNREDETWLDADLGELPPYDWGPEGPPQGKEIRYKPGVGLIAEGGEKY